MKNFIIIRNRTEKILEKNFSHDSRNNFNSESGIYSLESVKKLLCDYKDRDELN